MQPGFFNIEVYHAASDDWLYEGGFKDEQKAHEYAEATLYNHHVRIMRDGVCLCEARPLTRLEKQQLGLR